MRKGALVNYLPPFETLKNLLSLSTIRGKLVASAPYDDIQNLIRTLLSGIEVDEAWYLQRYPDIADAIKVGLTRSAKDHFLNNGYFEGRLPFPVVVDEAFYFAQYPEIAEAIRQGIVESAQKHFDEHGYKEGRLPHAL
jgi:hypothetical protein